MLSKCVWSRYQFPLQKSSSISPYFHGRNPAALCLKFVIAHKMLFTKLSMWEYGNGDVPFSCWKSSRGLRLVHYGAPARFRVCVYSMYRHARTVTSWNPSKHQVCWCVSYTWENQCHLVTWIETITPKWSCTQYSMNMHLRQLTWVHNHPHMCRHIYVCVCEYIYIHIHTSCTMQSHRVGK